MCYEEFEQAMNQIIVNIRKAGYSPYDQITGYLVTGNVAYITRLGGARELIQSLDKEQIKHFIQKVKEGN